MNSNYVAGSLAFELIGKLLHQVKGPSLNILMYHAVIDAPLVVPDYCYISSSAFSAQMDWLAERNVRVMDLLDAVAAKQEDRLNGPTVVITFDDGYRNNVEIALPILERHGFPATIFLTTGYTNRSTTLWPARIGLALSNTDRSNLSWRDAEYSLENQTSRELSLVRLQEAVKSLAGDNPSEAVNEIEKALEVPIDPEIPRSSPFAMMDGLDIERALNSGLVKFGGHTVTHPILSKLQNAELATEIGESIAAVEEFTGQPCRSFSYPNGRAQDFDIRAMRIMRDLKIEAAVTTISGHNRGNVCNHSLQRIGIGPNTSLARFSSTAHGLPLEGLASTAGRLRRRNRA